MHFSDRRNDVHHDFRLHLDGSRGMHKGPGNGGPALCVWLYKDACTLKEASWSGPVVDGKADGKGVLTASYHCEGDPAATAQCDGIMKEGRLNGKGVCRSPEGEAYEGDFLDGKREGKGVYKWPDGRVHTGDYKNNQPNGKGVLKNADGTVYEGDFRDGNLNGKGTAKGLTGQRIKAISKRASLTAKVL